jgi:hypothetical protein
MTTQRVSAMLDVRRRNGVTKWLAGFLLEAALTTILVGAAVAQTPSFRRLGQMPGVWPAAGTYSSAISGDGSTIMGYGWVCANGGCRTVLKS